MIVANCEPSCSKSTRWAVGVFGLKNASQFLVMVAADAGGGLAAGELVAGELAGADGVVCWVAELLGLLLPQAAAVVAKAISAQAPRICETRR
jgi:hypothetical protein